MVGQDKDDRVQRHEWGQRDGDLRDYGSNHTAATKSQTIRELCRIKHKQGVLLDVPIFSEFFHAGPLIFKKSGFGEI